MASKNTNTNNAENTVTVQNPAQAIMELLSCDMAHAESILAARELAREAAIAAETKAAFIEKVKNSDLLTPEEKVAAIESRYPEMKKTVAAQATKQASQSLATAIQTVRGYYVTAGYTSAPCGSVLFNALAGRVGAILPGVNPPEWAPRAVVGLTTNPALCAIIQGLYPGDYCGESGNLAGTVSQFKGKYVWVFSR